MATITLGNGDRTLATIELGEAVASPSGVGYFDEGALATSCGNLYVYVDGAEMGSLFFHTLKGSLWVELGQFDPLVGMWDAANPIKVLPDGAEDVGPASVGE